MTNSNKQWRKSSYSGGTQNACVEVAVTSTSTGVRDSKAPTAGHLSVAPAQWAGFLAAVRDRQIAP